MQHGKKLHNLKLRQEQPTTLINVNVPSLSTMCTIFHLTFCQTKNTPLFHLVLIINLGPLNSFKKLYLLGEKINSILFKKIKKIALARHNFVRKVERFVSCEKSKLIYALPWIFHNYWFAQSAFTYSKLTIETV